MPWVKQSLFRSSGALRVSSMDLLLLCGFPGLTNKLSSKHVTHWKEYMREFKYSTFHSFWKWTLSCITFRGEVVIDKCSFHKVISTLLFKFALPMLLFLLNRLIQKMKTLGYILGNPLLTCFFIPYPFFHFLLFKMLQESWDFFIAIPFKIHFQNLLREDLMESFSSSVGGS